MAARFPSLSRRVGQLRAASGEGSFAPSSIDDDNIATYIFSRDDDSSVVSDVAANAASIIRGPRGSRVQLKIASSLDLRTSAFLFNQLGSTGTTAIGDLASGNYKFIDTIVRVSGVSTGYTLDVPVRFVKQN